MTKECRLAIKAAPQSTQNTIVGWEGDELKIRLRAVPEKGKANLLLIEFLAKILDISKSSITLIRGETSRHKLLRIQGLDQEEVRTKIHSQLQK